MSDEMHDYSEIYTPSNEDGGKVRPWKKRLKVTLKNNQTHHTIQLIFSSYKTVSMELLGINEG